MFAFYLELFTLICYNSVINHFGEENENVKEYMRTKLKQEKAMNVVVENVKEK